MVDKVLARCEFDATDEAGNLLTNVSVEVRLEGGGLVPVYSDRGGTVALGNPFTASDGHVGFHVGGGAYKVTLTQGAYSRIRRYVAIGRGAETDMQLATPRGAYDSGVTYGIADMVYAGGKVFIGKVNGNVGNTPDSTTPGDTTQWMYAGQAVAGPQGNGLEINASGTYAGRSAYDTALANFVYYATDGDGGATTNEALFVKLSNTSGDWGPAISIAAAPGVHLVFDTTTTDSDPGGPGKIRADNGTFASIAHLYLDGTDTGGKSLAALVALLTASVNVAARSTLNFTTDGGVPVMSFAVTGAAVDGGSGTYWKLPVTPLTGALPANLAALRLTYSINGADGAITSINGQTGSAVTLKSAGQIENLSLDHTVSASALTCAVKQADGSSTPSSSHPVLIGMRSATANSGAYNQRSIAGALSLTVPSGATLGHANGVAGRLYWYFIDNAGTLELAVSSTDFGEAGIVSTTAISGSSTSLSVMYSASARSNVPFRRVARTLDTQTTAGTWATKPSSVEMAPFTAIVPTLVGDSGSGGVAGLVPAPAAGDAAAGKILRASGSWGAPPALDFLGNYTGTSQATADISFAGFSAYRGFEIEINWLTVATSAATLLARLSQSGSFISSAAYVYGGYSTYSAGAGFNMLGNGTPSSPATSVTMTQGLLAASSAAVSGKLSVFSPSTAALRARLQFELSALYNVNNDISHSAGSAYVTAAVAGAVDGLRLLASSGNISYDISLFGRR